MTTDIIFSKSCYRYIIRFTYYDNDEGKTSSSFFNEISNNHVISTVNIWSAKKFFSKKEAEEVLTACNAIWPSGNGKLCKVFMSAPVEEETV